MKSFGILLGKTEELHCKNSMELYAKSHGLRTNAVFHFFTFVHPDLSTGYLGFYFVNHLAYLKCLNNLGISRSTYPSLIVNWLSIVISMEGFLKVFIIFSLCKNLVNDLHVCVWGKWMSTLSEYNSSM